MSSLVPPPNPATGTRTFQVVLTGNPNCGKTTLFNALTGLRAKVGNYPGVTVERKEGRLVGGPRETRINILDIPGTYSLAPQSIDEQISRDILLHRLPSVPAPDLVVVVVDASNLQRNLYFATQVIELGYPTLIALNMTDVAVEMGYDINTERLSQDLGVPVLATVANQNRGIDPLTTQLVSLLRSDRPRPAPKSFCPVPPSLLQEAEALSQELRRCFPESKFQAMAEAILILSDERFEKNAVAHYPPTICQSVTEARGRLEQASVDWRSAAIESRYRSIGPIQEAATLETVPEKESVSDRLDRVFTHRLWGPLFFLGIMAVVFQTIFTFASLPMDLLVNGVSWIGAQLGGMMEEGALRSLLVDGVIEGVGAVVVFLPQICLLFLFIGIMEDTGYMARAAFLMDRLMSKVGLHGKSFIPMLSSFACAIPGIMATRTIENPKDRLATILVAPLMSCSARLPVYTVLIGACIPQKKLMGFLGIQGLTMLAMYLLGIVVALLMAWLFKKTLLKGPTPVLIMELPPYKKPLVTVVLRHMWDRAKLFLRRAGTVILGISILLWFLQSYPKSDAIESQFAAQRTQIAQAAFPNLSPEESETARAEQLSELDRTEAGANLRHSFAGRLGHTMEPVIRPLGFDWKIGIGLVASFAAREVFVSTMSQVYNIGDVDESEEGTRTLVQTIQRQTKEDGTKVYTTLVGITLMVFYVFALQCVSTVAVVRRETNSWKWPIFQWVYMGLLAWGLAFFTYQGGRLLGLE